MNRIGPFNVLMDGDCPYCRRVGGLLRLADGGRGRVVIQDIAAPGFDPQKYGLTPEAVERQIHGVTWDGRILRGMDVFRQACAAVGLGWLAAPTGWPLIRPLTNTAYNLMSHNHLCSWHLGSSCGAGRCPSN